MDEADDEYQRHHRRDTDHDAERPDQPMHLAAQQVGREPIQAGPSDAPQRVPQQEVVPLHPVRTGQDGGERPQEHDEAPQEHHLTPVPQEQELPQPLPVQGQPDARTIPRQHRRTHPAANDETQVVADDGPDSRSQHDQANAEVSRSGSI